MIDTTIVEPEETEALLPEDGRDLMTLVTCTPIGINTHRILVTGERVIPTPRSALDDAGSMPEGPGFPWWVVASLVVLVLASAYVWWSGRPPRTRAPTPV